MAQAGNRLTASLRKGSLGAGNQFQLKSREESAVVESNGKSGSGGYVKFTCMGPLKQSTSALSYISHGTGH